MKAEIQTLCSHAVVAAVNGVYQGMLLTFSVGVLLRLLRRTNAATRHAVWLASLVWVVLIVPAHFWLATSRAGEVDSTEGALTIQSLPPLAADLDLPPARPVRGEPIPQNEGPPEEAFVIPELTVIAPALSDPVSVSGHGEFEPATTTAQPAANVPLPREVLAQKSRFAAVQSPEGRSVPSPRQRFRSLASGILNPVLWRLESSLALPVAPLLLGLWLIPAAVRFVALGVQIWQLRKLTNDSCAPGLGLQRLFERLRAVSGVKRRVTLRIGGRQRCPVVLGFFNPVILLPAELSADEAEVQHVLYHELAHVRRYDDWANLFQHVAQAWLFFHPAVWWIGKRLSLEREIACDDSVLQQGSGRRGYALILTRVAGRINQQIPLLASGVSNSQSQLQQRISMILNTRRNASPCLATGRLTTIVGVTALLAGLALCSAPRMVFAGSPPAAPTAVISSGSGAVLAATSAPDSADLVAEAAPAGAAVFAAADTPSVSAGPKFKPGQPAEPVAPVDLDTPEPPEPPTVEVSPTPTPMPRVARAPKANRAPRAPEMPEADENNDGSIEQRLKRVEKMLKSLMDQQGVKHSHGMIYYKDSKDGKDDNEATWNFDGQQMDKMKQQAERQAARAAEQAQRAAEQAKRMAKDFEARADQDHQNKGELREAVQRQLEALRKAREGLNQEMERLSRQIEKLERDQQRGQRDVPQRRGEITTEKLQAGNYPALDGLR